MKHLLFRPYFLFVLLFSLNFTACGPPGTGSTTGDVEGNRAADSTGTPDQGNGGKSHPYTEAANLINPNHFEFFQDFERYRDMPFNAGYLAQNGIRRVEMALYKDDDNDFTQDNIDEQRVLSGNRVVEFDGNGNLRLLETERLADGQPWVKLAIRYDYNPAGQLVKALIRDIAFEDVNESEVNYIYKADGRLFERNDPAGVSNFYRYDAENQHSYRLDVTPAGSAAVHVTGKPGDFSDARCLALQDEILSLASKFVDYAKAPGLVRDVLFYEKEGRKIVRQVNMGANGSITGTVDHAYNDFDNLSRKRFLWDEPEALFRSEKVFNYNPANDLTEIIHKRVRNNGENSTEIWRFGYSPEGLWNRFSKHKRVENGPETTLEINLVKLKQEASLRQPKPRAVPGGTN